jgi:hypothetical protein
VRLTQEHGADRRRPLRRELLLLVLAVVAVDALFVAGYFLFRLPLAADSIKLAFTVGWTAVTLIVVLRALTRIRALRRRG